MVHKDPPTIYVIAGPNGAGKTTFATEFLPRVLDPPQFLNVDLIAAGLSPLAPKTQSVSAGRILLERISELSDARQSFAFETTLSGRVYARRLKELRQVGYRILGFFLWLPHADLAVMRVANRVRNGGHDVPEADIRRRYKSGIANFFSSYSPLFDAWWLYDASQPTVRLLASHLEGQLNVEDEVFAEVTQSARSSEQ